MAKKKAPKIVRKKAPEAVRLDISNTFQPTAEGFVASQFEALSKLKANSVDEIQMNGVLEQIEGSGRPDVMREIYRVLKAGGKAVATVAHWATASASMSPFSKWPPLSPESFGFFSKEVRERSQYAHPELNDIDFEIQWAEMYPPDWQTKADTVRSFAARHYTNVLQGMVVTLTKKEKA